MTTKEKILEQALMLFSQKGYSNVYLSEIAKAVGIKAPSLYKHYSSKQEIFDCCIEVFYQRTKEMTSLFPFLNEDAVPDENITLEKFLQLTRQVFLFHLKEPTASALRRTLAVEQFQNESLRKIYEELFLDEPIRYETELFRRLMDHGVLKAGNPELMAYHYYAPLFFLLSKYDLHSEQEQKALEQLDLISKSFYEMYKV